MFTRDPISSPFPLILQFITQPIRSRLFGFPMQTWWRWGRLVSRLRRVGMFCIRIRWSFPRRMFMFLQSIDYDVIFCEVGGSGQTLKFTFARVFFVFDAGVICDKGLGSAPSRVVGTRGQHRDLDLRLKCSISVYLVNEAILREGSNSGSPSG